MPAAPWPSWHPRRWPRSISCCRPVGHGANPVDIIGDAPGSRYAEAYQALAADPGIDALLALNCPTAVASSPRGRPGADRGDAARPASRCCSPAGSAPPRWPKPAPVSPGRASPATTRRSRRCVPSATWSTTPRRGSCCSRPAIDSRAVHPRRAAGAPADRCGAGRGTAVGCSNRSQALFEAYAIATVPTRRAATPARAAAITTNCRAGCVEGAVARSAAQVGCRRRAARSGHASGGAGGGRSDAGPVTKRASRRRA